MSFNVLYHYDMLRYVSHIVAARFQTCSGPGAESVLVQKCCVHKLPNSILIAMFFSSSGCLYFFRSFALIPARSPLFGVFAEIPGPAAVGFAYAACGGCWRNVIAWRLAYLSVRDFACVAWRVMRSAQMFYAIVMRLVTRYWLGRRERAYVLRRLED